MKDCADQVGSAKFVSKFDLLKAYWQVPLSPRAREIAAFITPSGLYSYTIMPFGLRNAPATFQRLMNKVVSGLTGAVYLDNVVINSDSWEDYLQCIRQLFDRLAWACLTINQGNCHLPGKSCWPRSGEASKGKGVGTSFLFRPPKKNFLVS